MQERLLSYIDRISQILGKHSTFGIYDEDDIKQEIFLLVFAAQTEYDSTKGDEFSFFFHYCRRRLLTLKRNKHVNPKIQKAEKRAKLLNAGELNERCSVQTANPELDAIESYNYVAEIVDKKIPPNLRLNYLKYMEGIDLPYHDKTKLLDVIKTIVKANNVKTEL